MQNLVFIGRCVLREVKLNGVSDTCMENFFIKMFSPTTSRNVVECTCVSDQCSKKKKKKRKEFRIISSHLVDYRNVFVVFISKTRW